MRSAVSDSRVRQSNAIPLFSHDVIVRAPGLLPMRYKPAELADELRVTAATVRGWVNHYGLPHKRGGHDEIWIVGTECAQWIRAQRKGRQRSRLKPDEAFCFNCDKPVRYINPTEKVLGNRVMISAACAACGRTVNRIVARHDQSK
jgi:hypothetical protein